MSYETLDWQIADRILTLTLNRPDKLNAFTTTMARELVAAFERASEDDEVGAIVVTGAGRAFCAGMDLSAGSGNVFGLDESQNPTLQDLRDNPEDAALLNGVRDTGGRVTLSILNCKKPVMAAVNGAAVGIGATMTLAMDFRLASNNARYGFVFGKIGIVPEACSSWMLPRLVGITQALEWAYTGDIVDAATAQRTGLVKDVLAPEALLGAAVAFAHRLVDGKSPVAIALTRQMLLRNSLQPSPLEAHYIESLAVFHASQADGKEGVAAFLEKRPANFTSKASQMPPFYPWWTQVKG